MTLNLWHNWWGWPRKVCDIYERACRDIDAYLAGHPETVLIDPLLANGEHALRFGPGTVVWDDQHWDCADHAITECITPDQFMAYHRWPPGILTRIRRSLEELKALPRNQVEVCPDDYDDEHPERYPPPAGVEMVGGISSEAPWR